MECTVSWTGASGTRSAMGFVAETGSGHVIAMDGAPDPDKPDQSGQNMAARPMELLLAGAGCASVIWGDCAVVCWVVTLINA
jgi:putative redox protein